MKALVYDGPGNIEYREHPMPTLHDDTDIVMRIAQSTICGTDAHIIKCGVPTVQPGTVLGHEATGIVTEVGGSVKNVKPGDRILAVCVSACGYCRFCTSGLYGQCLNGGWALGNTLDGVQAEYARIPFARNSVYKIPDNLTDEQVLFLTDILATGYEVGVLNGRVQPGDTVVIVGAGPVGLSATLTVQLFSPRNIVVVDRVAGRRETALKLGATHAVDEHEVHAVVDQLTDRLGADVTIEAVGFLDASELTADLVRSGGRIANIGVHEGTSDPAPGEAVGQAGHHHHRHPVRVDHLAADELHRHGRAGRHPDDHPPDAPRRDRGRVRHLPALRGNRGPEGRPDERVSSGRTP
ncbi:alcohol dehydrogenase catalytic domain-containing protein [Amycolatopsis nalaikhensis]|uniref:Alcohol dehydrogenase catalytic domain-containing protein n=1 Tax=Amycolatopsis nalaikhensis TaxID=715472 RepID=A0ABY8X936_9PSEU|nr:alcohol dehydrogenase catalytic domain-containing protein [Amycolatopsis sp. 2-2]WIV52914.1 alcohol dehydrogenase catalytic domain-containing protein [Amycolatopsis sp. 2-2]